MRNRFGGVCYRCNEWCEIGDGHPERHRGEWRVQHATCAIVRRTVNERAAVRGADRAIDRHFDNMFKVSS